MERWLVKDHRGGVVLELVGEKAYRDWYDEPEENRRNRWIEKVEG